jgi:hypothetical protein
MQIGALSAVVMVLMQILVLNPIGLLRPSFESSDPTLELITMEVAFDVVTRRAFRRKDR